MVLQMKQSSTKLNFLQRNNNFNSILNFMRKKTTTNTNAGK